MTINMLLGIIYLIGDAILMGIIILTIHLVNKIKGGREDEGKDK